MKRDLTWVVLAGLLLVSCQYEVPLTREHSIAVDSSILGLWEPIPDEGEEAKQDERMMILKYSDTEYMIHYPVGKDALYWRAYPVRLGGRSCVQLQVIGTVDGPLEEDEQQVFHVASYQRTDDVLVVKTLNIELVGNELKTTEALVQAFLDHKESKDLFIDPETFRQIKD